MTHQMESVVQRAEGPLDIATYPSTVIRVMGDGQPLVEACTLVETNGTRRFLFVDADEEDDSAQDRRYAIDVAHEQGQSTVYIMATSVGEVKRNMRQKAGYVVLAIRVHG